jgi:cytochrome c556
LSLAGQPIVERHKGIHHMFRFVLAVVAVTFALSAATAEEDAIKERKEIMKANGDQAKIGSDMIKGAKPFDLDAVHKMFATFQDAAAKMPTLFPENSKPTEKDLAADDFSAGPKIWENMADVKARFSKLGEDAKAADASVKNVNDLKEMFTNMGKKDCGGCHELYRLKKS